MSGKENATPETAKDAAGQQHGSQSQDPAGPPEIFISYSTKDGQRVREFAGRLQAEGFTVWLDKTSIVGGSSWRGSIAEGIQSCKVFLLVGSASSLASKYVKKEIEFAVSKERNILPVFLEDVELPGAIQFELGDVQNVDLFGADEQAAFQKVVTALDSADVSRGESIPWQPPPPPRQPWGGYAALCFLLVVFGAIWWFWLSYRRLDWIWTSILLPAVVLASVAWFYWRSRPKERLARPGDTSWRAFLTYQAGGFLLVCYSALDASAAIGAIVVDLKMPSFVLVLDDVKVSRKGTKVRLILKNKGSEAKKGEDSLRTSGTDDFGAYIFIDDKYKPYYKDRTHEYWRDTLIRYKDAKWITIEPEDMHEFKIFIGEAREIATDIPNEYKVIPVFVPSLERVGDRDYKAHCIAKNGNLIKPKMKFIYEVKSR